VVEVFNRTFKRLIRDIVLASRLNANELRNRPELQKFIMDKACAQYNDAPHSSMPANLTPAKLATHMFLQNTVPDSDANAPGRLADKVVEFRRKYYRTKNETGEDRVGGKGKEEIRVGQFVRVTVTSGQDFADNDAKDDGEDGAASRRQRLDMQRLKDLKERFGKGLGINFTTRIYVVVGKRYREERMPIYYVAPATEDDFIGAGMTQEVARQKLRWMEDEYQIPRHIGLTREELLPVDVNTLQFMHKDVFASL
jgi:hypothetical protein